MVSLRNEVRKKRRAAENKLVQISQGFCQDAEKYSDTRHRRNDSSVRFSNNAERQGVVANVEEARVCTKESDRFSLDESDRVSTGENSRVCRNKISRVCADKNDAVQLLIPKEDEEFRVATEEGNSAFQSLMKKAEVHVHCFGEDVDEDNVPIGRILLRSKKKQQPCLQNYSDGENSLQNPTSVKYDVTGGGKDVKVEQKDRDQKKTKLILQSDNDNNNVLLQEDVPSGGKDAKVEKKDKVQKKKQVSLSNDDDNFDVPLQNMMPVKDKGHKKKLVSFQNDNDNFDIPLQKMMRIKDDVPCKVKDVKVNQKDKGQRKKQLVPSNDNDDSDVPSQNDPPVEDDVPCGGKDVKVEHQLKKRIGLEKDKVQKKNQLSLSIDDDNYDVPLQNMMPVKDKGQKKKLRSFLKDDKDCDVPLQKMMPVKYDVPDKVKDAKVEQKDKGQKKKQIVPPNGNDDGDVPSQNDVAVDVDVPRAGKHMKVERQNDDQMKKQLVLENDNDDSDVALENNIPAKDDVFDICKDVKVEEKDKGCDLRRASKFQEGDMVWAKVKSHPWWPGQVYNPIFAAPKARKPLKPDHVLIAFFGDSSYGWFHESDLVPFEPNYVQKSKQTTQRGFAKAVEEAVDEISRRAALGLMCACRNGDAFRPRKQEGYVNVDVRGYVTSGLYLAGQIEAAKSAFKPADMLSFVRCLAILPGSGEVKCISGIKSVAEVLAYRAATFVSVNEHYWEALRIAESTAYFGTDLCDQYELESKVVCRESTGEPARVDEQKEIPEHVKVKNLTRRSIMLGKASDKEDSYMFKKREGINRLGSTTSDDCLMNYVIQSDFLQNPPSNSEIKDDDGDDMDCIGTYVFKKRMQIEVAERKGERKEKKKRLLKEGDEFKEEQARKKVVRKAFHMKPLDREKESGKSPDKGDITEAQAREKEVSRKAFHMRPLEKEEETQKSILPRKTGQVEELNVLSNYEVGMSDDVSLISGSIQESNDLSVINDLVGSHDAQVEGGQRLVKISHQKKQKKPTDVKNIFNSDVSPGNMFEAEGKCIGSDKSSEGEQQISPSTMCADEIDHTGNALQERPIHSGKESSDPSKLRDPYFRDTSNELQGILTNFVDVNKESFPVNDVEHGNGVLVTAKKTSKHEPAALESDSSGEFDGREVLHNVDLLACNTLPASEGQKIVSKANNVFQNAGQSIYEGVPLFDNSIEPKILKSGGSGNSFGESSPKDDNIQLDTETEKTSYQLPPSSADVAPDVSPDVNDAGCNFSPSLELKGNLDHAVIKKTKGFKRLVKFEKSSGSKDTSDRRVKQFKRIRNNDTCLLDYPEQPKKQRKVSEAVESKSESPKDLLSGIDTVDSIALDYGMAAALVDDNQVLSPIYPDQSEGNEIPCKDMYCKDSRSCIREIMDDLLSLALNPFYGIERDCPFKVSQVFVKFRSLVYQKSLTSISSLESKNLPSLHEIEADPETKNKSGVEESFFMLPLSNSKDLNVDRNVEDGVDDVSADLEPNEIALQLSSKMEHSASQVLKTGKIQAVEAKENKKRKLEIQSGSSSSLRRLKKSKDLDSARSKKSDSRSSAQKSSRVLRRDFHESAVQPKVLKKSHFGRSLEVPMALCMKFPPGFALPSEMQLKVRFARFGPLDVSGIRIYCNSSSAQVVFKHSSDAETAYIYATENSLFGQADVSFRLKQIIHQKKETSVSQSGAELSRLSRSKNDDMPSLVPAMGHEGFSSLSSLDKHGITEFVADCTPKSILTVQPVVQLKSCLKKLDDSVIDSGKETTRVTFLLGREEPGPAQQIAMEELSQIENVNIPASTSLLENNTFFNPPNENNAMESDPPNISHQMMYLLTKCNDMVTDIGRSLGYVPYCPL